MTDKAAEATREITSPDIIALTDRQQLDRWGDQWNDLAMGTTEINPMSSYAYVSSWLDCRLRPEDGWVCVLAKEGSRLLAVMPLLVEKRKVGPLSYTTVTNPFYVEPIIPGQSPLPLLDGMAKQALAAVPQAISVELRHIRSDWIDRWLSNGTSLIWIKQFDSRGSYLKTAGGYGEFESGLRSKTRQNTKRLHRKLLDLPGAREFVADKKEQMLEMLDKFIDLEASGWKGEKGTAIKDDPVQVDFYRTFVPRLASLNACQWHVIEAEGTPLGMQLVLTGKDMFFTPKIAYNEQYSKLGPGKTCHWRTIGRAFEAPGIHQIDFLSDMPWHSDWNVLKRNYVNLYLFSRTPKAILLGVIARRLAMALSKR